MQALTAQQLRACLVNTSRRETTQALLPELDGLNWAALDYLGWHDPKRPQQSYVVMEVGAEIVGIAVHTAPRADSRRKATCAWCQDIVAGADVSMYVARRVGARGRRGDTVGTLICTDFGCSRNVRRTPLIEEVGSKDPRDRERFVARRVAGLRERSAEFVVNLLGRDPRHE